MITLRGQFFIVPLISFILGIILQAYLQQSLLFLVLATLGMSTALIIVWNKGYTTNKILILCPLLLMAGATQISLQKQAFTYAVNHYTGRTVTLIAIVTDKEVYPHKWQQMVTLAIPYTNSFPWLGSISSLRCFLPIKKDIQVGDTITIYDLYIPYPFPGKTLSKNSVFLDYLVKEGILTYLFFDTSVNYTITRPSWSLYSALWQKKQELYLAITKKLSPVTKIFYDLIFLGNKGSVQLEELGNQCNMWGISHFLARSGLHIALLIIMWKWLLSFIPIPLFVKYFILIMLALVYNLLSWGSISFLRAYMLFLLLHQGMLLSQRVLVPHLFNIICFLVLFFNPYQLFFLDFQLSFALTYVLITFCSVHKTNKPSHKKSLINAIN